MKNLLSSIQITLIVLLSFQLVSCGTILYPERRNQAAGRIDVGVALLDGFWLLVGIIPGIIAFAVDFSTGAIYVPASKTSGIDGYRVVRFEPGTSQEEIEEIIRRETGKDFSFSDDRLQVTRTKIKDRSEIPVYLANLEQ